MTNAEKIREGLQSDRELAILLVQYYAELDVYRCSDGVLFKEWEYSEALNHEIAWLHSNSNLK